MRQYAALPLHVRELDSYEIDALWLAATIYHGLEVSIKKLGELYVEFWKYYDSFCFRLQVCAYFGSVLGNYLTLFARVINSRELCIALLSSSEWLRVKDSEISSNYEELSSAGSGSRYGFIRSGCWHD